MTPALSIVIVNFNGGQHLENCLASLAAHPPSVAFDTVVVDNASTDNSLAPMAARPNVTLTRLPKNVGFSAANNVGIRQTSGRYVLLLNNDTIVKPGALDALLAPLQSDAAVGITGPRLVDAEGRPELSFGAMMSPLAELRQKAVTTLHERGVDPVSKWIERRTRERRLVDWVSGACLAVRRVAAEAAGLLDERFFLYTEDVDFCSSVRARGWKVLFVPEAEIVHLRGRSRATVPDRARAAYRRSHLAFYAKHHPRWFPVLRAYLRMKGEIGRADRD